MAIIRDTVAYDNTANYLATLALFCAVTCTILMLRFRGFRASLNFNGGKRTSSEFYEDIPISTAGRGAYRTNREEFFGNGTISDPPKKITPSMVKLPPGVQSSPAVRPSQSTSDLTQSGTSQSNVRKSTPNVSSDPQGGATNVKNSTEVRNVKSNVTKNELKDQKKLEKKKLAEQKKREKLAAQEQAKQEKLRKEREKQEVLFQAKQAKLQQQQQQQQAKQQQQVHQQQAKQAAPAKEKKEKDKKTQVPVAPPRANPLAQGSAQYSTNTLESSISRTSGPPAYSELPKQEVIKNQKDNTGNTSFSKPIDNSKSSWDMISQHREQMSRPQVMGGGKPKQMVMDLQYNTAGRSSDETDVRRDSADA